MTLNIFDNKFIPDSFLKKVAAKTFENLNITKDLIINLSFVSEKKIRELNKKYRGVDEVTDVLSFKADFSDPYFLGDILICYGKAKRQAKEYRKDIKDEIALILIHGILHLFDYDHKKGKEASKMKKIETEILNSLEIKS